jgi:hypothetical protein
MDLLQVQNDWLVKLLSEPLLDRVNVIQLRKEVIASRIDFSLLTKTKRNGRLGCGAVVEMPTVQVSQQAGPLQVRVELSVLIAEAPTLNLSPTAGTLLSAEEVAMRVLQIGHGFFVEGVGEFVAPTANAVEAAEFDAGHVAYRVRFQCLGTGAVLGRVNVPTASVESGMLTLACATAGAEIYWSWDGSLPGPGSAAAMRYEGPVPVAAGWRVRTAAYLDGMVGSHVDEFTVS